MTFVKVNTDKQKDIAQAYRVTALPTFIVFANGKVIERVQGADPLKLQQVVRKLNDRVDSIGSGGGEGSSSGSGGERWLGAELPRGYQDITGEIELPRCELLNVDGDTGSVRVLFSEKKPSALSGSKSPNKDWVESDTDEQMLLFMPFQSMLKLHTLQVRLPDLNPNGVSADRLLTDDASSHPYPHAPKTVTTTTKTRCQCGHGPLSCSPTSHITLGSKRQRI